MKIRPLNLIDFYKADHIRQYPKGTEKVYSNFTPRMSRVAGVDGVVIFGIRFMIKEYLVDLFNKRFFALPLADVLEPYRTRMDTSLGKDAINIDHVEALHKLGYLPLEVKALPEGAICPIGVPMLTIVNTKPEFFWLTNYLESLISCLLWKPITSATLANEYRKEFNRHAELAGYGEEVIQWQAHDFSFRGMSGIIDAMMSSAGHLLSFTGTDFVHSIDFLEEFYKADASKELIGGSIPATEHSVMCAGGKIDELGTFKRLITELYPNGLVSVVSDTWDFWKVMTEFLPSLKDEIMARDGRVVIRPDSGDPVRIICGYREDEITKVDSQYFHHILDKTINLNGKEILIPGRVIKLSEAEIKGAYQILAETFGTTKSSTGYDMLNSHIGLIYGDSITLDRQKEILARLEAKKLSASNLVLGVGLA